MVVRRDSGAIEHHTFRDLPGLLRSGDLLVVNDTRVMAARLAGTRLDTGGAVEALLVHQLDERRWETLFKPARQAVAGRVFSFLTAQGPVAAAVEGREDGIVTLTFERPIDPATAGTVPLPPYIKGYAGDPERYQTVYSREARSAAAPTAGLHFTPELFEALAARGIARTAITLEVGPGTFLPVTADDPAEHAMHEEVVRVGEAAAAAIARTRAEGGRVVAVGTTAVRTLEHVAAALGEVRPYEGATSLKILPGYRYRAVDALITNFHLPRSTLLMLVCAFAGTELVLAAYRAAVERGYRFYSFGDAMLIV